MVRRWQFYQAILSVCHQWRAILRIVSLRFIIIECPSDAKYYVHLVSLAKAHLQEKEAVLRFFDKTHVRADASALVLPPMLPSCRSLELTDGAPGNQSWAGEDRLFSWLRIRNLQSVAFLNLRLKTESVLPTKFTHLHYHLDGVRQVPHDPPEWLKTCLLGITHLRVSSPQPLTPFVRYVKHLEELIVDLHGFADFFYTIVAALKAGLLRGSRKKLILNTGPHEPSSYNAVKATCDSLNITFERRIVYSDDKSLVCWVSIS